MPLFKCDVVEISTKSPVGKAILGEPVSDEVIVESERGRIDGLSKKWIDNVAVRSCPDRTNAEVWRRGHRRRRDRRALCGLILVILIKILILRILLII